MIKQKTENYRLEEWIDGSFTIWGRGADDKPTPLMDLENQEELQEVCSLLCLPTKAIKLPYKVWYAIAYHYAIAQNAAGQFSSNLLRYEEGHPERAHWKQMYMASFSKANAFSFTWKLLGGAHRILEDWYEEMKRRWSKGEHDYPNASIR
jgi:hypothetical protein